MFVKGQYFVKILVTGGAGYVGGTVAALLASKGHNPIVFDNLCHSRREEVPEGVEFVQGDLADRPLIENMFISATDYGSPFDAVLHFAALIEAGESMRTPEVYFRNNTASTLSLLEAVLAKGPKRLVFSSTAAVYGEPESVPIDETARLNPTNVYGESKLIVEQMLTWFNKIHGLRYTSLRYFNVAGAPEGPSGVIRGEAHEPESHLIPLILDVALGRRMSINIYGDDYPTPDGTCIRDYIHVSDLADAHLLALGALEAAAPATPRSSSQAQRKPFANWAGNPDTPSSTISSARHGSGIRSATTSRVLSLAKQLVGRIRTKQIWTQTFRPLMQRLNEGP